MTIRPHHLRALFAKARRVREGDPTFTDDAFKALVAARYGVRSRNHLTPMDFHDLCDVLDAMADGAGVPPRVERESEAGRRTEQSQTSLHSLLEVQGFVNEAGLPWQRELVTDADLRGAVSLLDDFRLYRKGRRLARGVAMRIIFDAGADRTKSRRPWADFSIGTWREALGRWQAGGRRLNEHFFRGIMANVERDARRTAA